MRVRLPTLTNDRPVVLASPDLRDSVLGVARSLAQAGLLRRFVTTLAFAPAGARGPVGRLFARLRRLAGQSGSARQAPDWLAGRIETHPSRELVRLASMRLGLSAAACDRVWEWAEGGFDRQVARAWAGRAQCLYGCEHASVETFRRQRAAGGSNVLWQVIAHHQAVSRLVAAELERFPAAVTAESRRKQRLHARVNARKDEQYELADLIVANSDYVRQTFVEAGIPAEKVVAIPTGCPPVATPSGDERKSGPMVFLCAGTQSLRKGTPVLLDAWRRLGVRAGAELWLVGNVELPSGVLRDLPPDVVLRPRVPRAELPRLYAQASVLVLPTFCEGRAYVVLEAVARGLPVITTPNAGCTDVVRDGVNGWVVPVGDSEAVADRLAACLADPEAVRAWGAASRELARRWQVDDFAREHAACLRRFLAGGRAGQKTAAGAGFGAGQLGRT